METTEFAIRILCAIGAGFLIGFERQWHHKAAGLRTNTLVALGASIFVLLSINISEPNGDVTRIISQVVTGIGFLGAGIIFKEGLNVHGLTTAATVWCSAAVGCTAAAGYYAETFIATLAITAVNLLLLPVGKWLSKRNVKKHPNSILPKEE